MNPDKFIETLDLLGYPSTNKLSASNLNSILSDPDLQDFFEYFCTLNEENVLTKAELDEYESISPEELASYKKALEDEETEQKENQEEERSFHSERLSNLEKLLKTLQSQKEMLKKHKVSLSEEKTACEVVNDGLRRIYKDYSENKIPKVESEMASTLNQIQKLINELQTVINDTQDRNDILPTLDVKDLEEYFDTEEKINKYVTDYIESNFQFTDETMTSLNIPGLFNEKLVKEMLILNKALNKSKIEEYQATCNYKMQNAELKFYREFKAGNYDYLSECSSIQLSLKLNEETANNEKLSSKEELLKSYLSNAVAEHLEAQCSQIALACSKEVHECYKDSLEKISLPLLHLVNQRARLQLLIIFVNLNQRNLQSIKSLINEALSFSESEMGACSKRKQQYEDAIKENECDEKNLAEDSLLLSACQVLSEVQHQNTQSDITVADLSTEVERLFKEFQNKKTHNAKQWEVIQSMEEEYSKLEKHVFKGKEFSEFMKSEQNLSVQLNQLDSLSREATSKFIEMEKEWKDKHKLLETNKNLRLSRSLFMLALLDEGSFRSFIGNIKSMKKHVQDAPQNV